MKLFKIQITLSLLMMPLVCVYAQKAQVQKPNILFIIADDLGWKDTGFNGSQFFETPNLDKMAAQGMFFANAYANAPNCAPSRAAIMSGQYAPRTGVYTVGSSVRGETEWRAVIPTPNQHRLDPEKITIAEALKPAGYTTGFVGKYHLGAAHDKNGPAEQGFDVNVAGCYNGKPYSYFSPYQHEILEDGPEGEYLTDRLTDEALKFIEDYKEGPFFLTMAYHSPHTPIQARDSKMWKYIPKPPSNGQFDPIYAAMIESLDDNIGRVMDKLETLGISKNTVVVFFSDNGGLHAVTSMKPLKGFKGMLYEGGIRVPMIVKWPGKVPAASICNEAVIGTDFYPTFLELAGAKPPKHYPLDGESIKPLFTQKKTLKRDAIFWHYPVYLQAGYGLDQLWRTTPVGVIRMGDYKLMEFFEDNHLELYNLRDDIGEANNLASLEPEITRQMLQRMRDWRKEIGAPFPLEKNPDYDPSSLKLQNKPARNRERIYYFRKP
ncbi:sulfatase [Fulvivirga sp. M361]|uniref:sulfatase n=1 Tax=Fulvivirga sp. M361 TaxID=2594266 RepID=UPI001C86E842|nr:sulfatase [Fulvivirga sp. M361]